MDCILSILMLCKIDNIHYERVTDCTDSTLNGYNIMSIVCTLYGYQDSALNHMEGPSLSHVKIAHSLERVYIYFMIRLI